MSNDIYIDEVAFKAASADHVREGLLGWITCRMNRSIQLDGITLRRTQAGEHTLSFPARRDGAGRQRFFVRPLDNETREQIERQVLRALGLAA
jgi:hypothetical protein